MATHLSVLAWRISWNEQATILGSQRVRHDWSNLALILDWGGPWIPMTGVFIEGHVNTQGHRYIEKKVTQWQKQRLKWCVSKSRNARESQKLAEDRRKQGGSSFSRTFRESRFTQNHVIPAEILCVSKHLQFHDTVHFSLSCTHTHTHLSLHIPFYFLHSLIPSLIRIFLFCILHSKYNSGNNWSLNSDCLQVTFYFILQGPDKLLLVSLSHGRAWDLLKPYLSQCAFLSTPSFLLCVFLFHAFTLYFPSYPGIVCSSLYGSFKVLD